MNYCSWMYQDFSKVAYIGRIILKKLRVFINFILFNLKNISDGETKCSYVKCKNIKFYYKKRCDDIFT